MKYFILLLIIVSGCVDGETATSNQAPLFQANVVKNLGGDPSLVNECSDRSFIEKSADLIVDATVRDVNTEWNEGDGMIVTKSLLVIDRFIKGSVAFEELAINTPGGCLKGFCQELKENPALLPGNELRLYLDKTGEGLLLVCDELGMVKND